MQLNVTDAGFLTSVQDLGRVRFRRFGVSSGGALDLFAMRIANLLAGNEESAAGLEITQGSVRVRFDDNRMICWCGGDYDVQIGARSIPAGHSALVSASDNLSISGPQRGCRGWLAISGGIDVTTVLESRSTDLRGNFGGLDGRALRDGDIVPLSKNSERTNVWIENLRTERIAQWSAPQPWSKTATASPVLRVVRGADWNRFDDVTIQRFTTEAFAVSTDSDRMGVRFDDPGLHRNGDVDLVSEAVAPGTIQIPPCGRPILLLGDCQTIGGYPKIAHVITVDLSVAAQLRAGDHVRFSEVLIATAHRLLLERERELERFRVGLSLRES
jgi:antagonist of KipI